MSLEQIVMDTLRAEVVPAMGCTEPVAVALAVSKVKELLNLSSNQANKIDKVKVSVSPNIFKNGLGVGIPGTNEVGLVISAALGFTACNSIDDLEVLKNVHEPELIQAKEMIKNNQIELNMLDTSEKIRIEASIESHEGFAKVIIEKRHNRFIYHELNGAVIYEAKEITETSTENKKPFDLTLSQIVETVDQIDFNTLAFLLEGLDMNKRIAEKGLTEKCGIGVGYVLNQQAEKGLLGQDLMNRAMAVTAAASDARMSGVSMPVMSSNGSGNNGLTAILPLAVYNDYNKVDAHKMAKAVAISHLVNSKIKNAIGRLSSICGCGVAAGTGASVAMTWLMGGSIQQLEGALQNMVANTAGMICDGAKTGCALKLATSASAAVQSAILSINDAIVPTCTGIVGKNAEKTVENLSRLSNEGMLDVDRIVIDIMKSYH